MMSLHRHVIFSLLATILVLAPAARSSAITRDQVMARAKAFAYHPWRCTTANLTASCDTSYQSVYQPGDYMGLPYDWGGFVSIFQFDQDIASGKGAGSYPSDGVLSCTTGLDCSGYVSEAWHTADKYGTSTLDQVSSVIDASDLLPGDAVNHPGYHVILFSRVLADGRPELYEAVGYNVHITAYAGWSYLDGFTPIRYDRIEGTTAGDPEGTPTHPIQVNAFPFSDSRDTSNSPSNVLDGCGDAPGTDESGPEYVYAITLTQPGTLTVSVSDDAGVDIDVHLYTSMNTNDCIARGDTSISQVLDCGTYYVVADTWVNASGQALAGAYDITMSFTPNGTQCGAGPEGYDPSGKAGDPCAYPNHEDLPFCNPNLGADTCIYTSTTSFCSHPCRSASDCGDLPGACCEDLGHGDFYCIRQDLCQGGDQDAGPDPGLDAQVDAGPDDSGTDDAGRDASQGGDAATNLDAAVGADSGPPRRDGSGGGCDCATTSGKAPLPWPLWVLLGLVAVTWRMRRRHRS